MKSESPEERIRISKLDSPAKAKREGRRLKLRDDWEKVKINIMMMVVDLKFRYNPALMRKLLETNDAQLIEGNNWDDTFWGKVNGKGKNLLGKILMYIRKVYKS